MATMHRSILTIAATFALLLAHAAPAEDAAKSRRGWHGETMPEGLERGAKEGEYLWPKDGSVMVWVPAGSFLMGSEKGNVNERPVHEVYLDGYYIDKYEVTWKQWKDLGMPYREIITGRLPIPEPPDWGIRDDDPVVNVSWSEARQYAEKVGKRLPSEAEWEKAARGTDRRVFPWGNEPPSFAHAMWMEHPLAQESLAPVTCCAAGASPYGVFNMAGNAMEWVEDIYDTHYYARSPKKNPVNRDPGPKRSLRGGSYLLEVETLRAADRYRLYHHERAPDLGFRLALSGVVVSP